MNFRFYNKTNFKQTDLGPLPQEWGVVRLGEVGEIITGNTPSKKYIKKIQEYWNNGVIDFIKPPDLQNRIITSGSEKISEKAIKKARIVASSKI